MLLDNLGNNLELLSNSLENLTLYIGARERIEASDVEKLQKFYSKLFGWKIEKSSGPIPYWIIETVPTDEKGTTLRPGVNGGMYKKDQPEFKPVNYISVESIDEYISPVCS